jgi:hypothetical protein
MDPWLAHLRAQALVEFRAMLDETTNALDVRQLRDNLRGITEALIADLAVAGARAAIEAQVRTRAEARALAAELARLEAEYQQAGR